MVAHGAGGHFDRTTLMAALRRGPPSLTTEPTPASVPAAAAEPAAVAVVPARWTLARIRSAVPELTGYSLSGVWRVLHRCRLRLRSAAVQQWSPDPAYVQRLRQVEAVLQESVASPGQVVTLFMDQMGFSRWPDPGSDWVAAAPQPAPLAHRGGAPNRPWRLVGTLDATTGRVLFRDNYIIGREQMSIFYRQLDRAYPDAERIYVVQDNWSIHRHPDVCAALERLPRITPVFLPTYAPWLNPIEKLWRWLRQSILRNHTLAGDWEALRAQVRAFLQQFAHGSTALLRYVGLLGDGHLAAARRPAVSPT